VLETAAHISFGYRPVPAQTAKMQMITFRQKMPFRSRNNTFTFRHPRVARRVVVWGSTTPNGAASSLSGASAYSARRSLCGRGSYLGITAELCPQHAGWL